MNRKIKNIKLGIFLVAALIIIVPLAWFLFTRLEGEKPTIVLELPSAFISTSRDLTVSISDTKSGVRKMWISLVKDSKEITLVEEPFPSAGLFGPGEIREKTIRFSVDPRQLGLSDGKAILRMAVWDYSWRGWLNGNQTYIEKNITIDTRTPVIEIYSRAHNVRQGGAGLVIYRISEPCPKNGVYVGDQFFPGYAGLLNDQNVQVAFFALNYTQGPGTEIVVNATDRAGNNAKAGLNHYIRRKKFKKDTVNVSDKFLRRKMPEFSSDLSNDPKATLIDKFLYINRELRSVNYQKIRELCLNSDQALYWRGRFLRLPKSAPRAGFADQRTYTYKGRVIDHQVHLGVDLASTEHSPVPAANSGVVVFAEPLGIYGRTVFVDHGCGLFSMYSHLNHIGVKIGQKVAKGDILGRTGSTGLAGGDHLHFGILIHGTFVNPIEWWDAAWIKNNISSKIAGVKSRLGQE
ncbi:MAG: M23 family metallopeptidase [Desulfobacterales bacterium]|nr:MAG: M23 family metallopeptidase [Desulfobacterales bacterium]